MSTFTKALVGAFLTGASAGLTGYLFSNNADRDLVPLLAAAVAGGLMGAGNYLKGLYTQVPWNGEDRRGEKPEKPLNGKQN